MLVAELTLEMRLLERSWHKSPQGTKHYRVTAAIQLNLSTNFVVAHGCIATVPRCFNSGW